MNNNMNPETMNQNPAPEQNTAPQPAPQAQPEQPVQPAPNPYAGQQNYGTYNQYQQPNQGQYQQQGGYQQNYYQQPNYVDESGLFSENKMARVNGTSATMKLGDWMKVDCLSLLSLIPCIGTIAYFVILCILTFSSKTNKSLKARYQASLIWAAIGIGVYLLIFLFVFVVLGVSMGELASEFSMY